MLCSPPGQVRLGFFRRDPGGSQTRGRDSTVQSQILAFSGLSALACQTSGVWGPFTLFMRTIGSSTSKGSVFQCPPHRFVSFSL